jgi:hypothetical protein
MNINEIIHAKRTWSGKYGRDAFNYTFLFESPDVLEFPTWEILKHDIEEIKQIAHDKIKPLENNIYKLKLTNLIYFWVENDNHEIILGVSLERKPRGYAIIMSGKSKNYKSKPPFASDLYLLILKDLKNDVIISDKTLSQTGFNTWHRLFKQGCKLLVYNTDEPGKSFSRINSEDELKNFYHKGKEFQKWRFVLSESLKTQAETWASFRIRLHREINNLPLEE